MIVKNLLKNPENQNAKNYLSPKNLLKSRKKQVTTKNLLKNNTIKKCSFLISNTKVTF